jgi:hypothetical protein
MAGNIGNAFSWLSALAVSSVVAAAAIVVRGATASSIGNTPSDRGVDRDEGPAVTRPVTRLWIGGIWWRLACIGILFGILVLAAQSSSWAVGDLPLAGRLGALVTCVFVSRDRRSVVVGNQRVGDVGLRL